MPNAMDLRLAVCDDTESERLWITRQTEDILRAEHIGHYMVKYDSAGALLEAINAGEQFHVLLLDVMMDGLSGMELARILQQRQHETCVVFVSSNREMALCGYEVSAVRFLAKPLDAQKLKEALLYCHRFWQEKWREKKEILLPTDEGQHRTSLSDILYVEAYDRGTRFALQEGIVDTRLKFSEVLTMLPEPAFVQCHRSYVVNMALVQRIYPNAFQMTSGFQVPISKHRSMEVNRKFMAYLAG